MSAALTTSEKALRARLELANRLGALAVGLRQAWRTDTETVISAEEVAAFYGKEAPEEIAA